MLFRSPARAADEQDDDVMITGTGHSTPGNPVALSKHTAKANGMPIYQVSPTSMFKIFTLAS